MLSRIWRWMGAWAIGTTAIAGFRQLNVPWPVALLIGGLTIGFAEILLEKNGQKD